MPEIDSQYAAPSKATNDQPMTVEPMTVESMTRHCARFRGADPRRALVQVLSTALPFFALLTAMVLASRDYYWAVILMAIPAGGLLVRFFIVQHDCGHGSFLASRRANEFVGRAMSVLTLTPYGLWRREHAMHHAGSGNLERRGIGDIETATVAEYRAMPTLERLRYRIYRHPAFLFGVGVPVYFLFIQRLPWMHSLPVREAWRSVMGLNLALVAIYGPIGWLVGFDTLALVALPIVFVAAAAGGWLFFIQHQFENTRWDHAEEWDFRTAAIYGSSYYVLPKVLQWFTGNIGLHHIHHLNSMIPNYRLQDCMDAMPALARINRLTILESLGCTRLVLWDEDRRCLIGFAEAGV